MKQLLGRLRNTFYEFALVWQKWRVKFWECYILKTVWRMQNENKEYRLCCKKNEVYILRHLARGKENWNKIVAEWSPMEYKRNKGGPLIHWRDKTEGEVGLLWHRAALDKKCWKRITKAYAQRQSGLDHNTSQLTNYGVTKKCFRSKNA